MYPVQSFHIDLMIQVLLEDGWIFLVKLLKPSPLRVVGSWKDQLRLISVGCGLEVIAE